MKRQSIMNNKVYLLILYIFIFVFQGWRVFPQEKIYKKYFNSFFGGGKERIFSTNKNIDNVIINSAYYDIVFFDNYSQVDICYYIENNGPETDFYWAYPVLEANIEKLFENTQNPNSRKTRNENIKSDYINYRVLNI